jgi:hypothetical protein
MLYCVSYINGIVGVFSSMEMVTELVLDRFFSLPFVIQAYRTSKDIKKDLQVTHSDECQDRKGNIECMDIDLTEKDSAEPNIEPNVDSAEPSIEPNVDSAEPSIEPSIEPNVDSAEPSIEPSIEPNVDSAEPSAEPNVDSAAADVNLAWIIMYKSSEMPAYVTDDKKLAEIACKSLNILGKVYEEVIDYYEQEIDTISSVVEVILDSFQDIYSKNGVQFNSSDNIIYY